MEGSAVTDKLRRLARLPQSRYPFVSVYLDTKNDAPNKHDLLRIFLKNRIGAAAAVLENDEESREGRASFAKDTERIHEFLEDEIHVGKGGDGHAVFACAGDGIFDVVTARRPFENQLHVSNRPLIRQLAVFLDEYEPVVAAVIDSRTARIFEIALGDSVSERELEGDVPRMLKPPEFEGYGDLKYQRDVKGHIDHHFKDVADHLARLVDGVRYRRIVLLGQDAVLAQFRRCLAKRVAEKVVATAPMDRRDARDRIVARTLEIVAGEEARSERELIRRIKNQTLSGNLGVFGLEATLEALNKGQIYKLVIDGDLKARGWRCRSCRALHAHLNDGCPYSKGGTDEVDHGDEAVKDALAQGAEIETVRRTKDLARMGHIGALLRYRE